MGGFLTTGQLLVLFTTISFVLGVVLSQRLKDLIFRTPPSVRAEMSALETAIIQQLQAELQYTVKKLRIAAGVPQSTPPPPPPPPLEIPAILP